jgi:hypothetical protein
MELIGLVDDPATDAVELDAVELHYVIAERAGMRLDSVLCPECPDPGLCAAEGECIGRASHPGLDVIA